MKIISFLILILNVSLSLADETLEFYPAADTHVTQEAENRNFGTSAILDLKTYFAGTRLLMKFDDAELRARLQDKEILSARLELPIQNHYVKKDGIIGLHRMLTAWEESGATWKCPSDFSPTNYQQDCAVPWLMWSHDPNNVTPYPYERSPFITSTIRDAQSVPLGFDLKSYVQELISGDRQNHGFAIFKISTDINDPLAFHSRESDVGPKLIVTFRDKTPSVLNLSAHLQASPLNGTIPLRVHFDASGSSAVSPKTVQRYELHLGNGTSVILDRNNPVYDHTFTLEGDFQPYLKITDSSGEVSQVALNIMAMGTEQDNFDTNYGYWINVIDGDDVRYAQGEKGIIKGDICKIWKTQSKNGECQWVDKSKLNIRAYFPDMTTEVSSGLNIVHSGNRRNFTFETPALQKDKLNVLTIMLGEIDPTNINIQALKSKIQLRIQALDQKISFYRQSGTSPTVLKVLEETLTNLLNLCLKIDQRTASLPSVLAQYAIPLQVENKVAAARYYSSLVGGFRFEFTSDIGNLFEGEKLKIKSRVTNVAYSNPTQSDLQGYNFKATYNNQSLAPQNRSTFPQGSSFEYTFLDSQGAGPSTFLNYNLEIEEKFQWWSRKLASSEVRLPVFPDTSSPIWKNPQDVPQFYRNLPILKELVEDESGKIDPVSFVASVSGKVNKILIGKFNASTSSRGSSYSFEANLESELPLEGTYHFTLDVQDHKGSKAAPSPYVKTITVDRTEPLILLPFTDVHSTAQRTFPLPVTIVDQTKIKLSVYVNGLEQVSSLSVDGDFSANLDLELNEGINFVRVQATDEVGNSTVVNYPAILLDTTPPKLISINIAENELIREKEFILKGSSDEPLSEVLVNGEVVELSGGPKSFSKKISHFVTGPQTLEIELKDLLGNKKSVSLTYRVQLNILRIELVSITPTPDGKLLVSGFPGAAKPGIEVEVDGGFFNTETLIATDAGEFISLLDPFKTVELTATDDETGDVEKYTLTFNADTTLSGIVKDPMDEPLPGVTVSIVSTGQKATTDIQGVFHIPKPALGDQKLLIDGSSIPAEYTQGLKEFSSVTINVAVGRLQQNVLDKPIYIAPKLLDGSETVITPDTAVTVESVHAPGVSLEIPANAVTFPDPEAPRSINMLEINAKKTSVELPEGIEPTTVIALEPSGLKFNTPVKLTLPNTNDFPDGLELVILSKNSTSGLWEIDGSATVNGDLIETKPGQGITHFSEVFAAPFGLEMTTLGPKDKPGVVNNIGELTTSVSLPSYNRLGQAITPQLIYKSSWATPTAVVSNVLNLPRKYYEFGGSLSQGSWSGKVKVNQTIQTWLTPDSIDSQFFVKDLASEKLTFEADEAPENAVVSYSVDLGSLDSGVYPTSASYEIKYRNLTIRTTKIKSKSLFGGTKTRVKSTIDKDITESIFPPDLRSLLFHQNKVRSSLGSGWKLAATQQIVNPGEDRLMVENEDGSVSGYTLRNSVETLYSDTEEMDVAFLGKDNILARTVNNKIKKIHNGSAQLIRSLPDYAGSTGVHLAGTWRYERYDHVVRCTYYEAFFSMPRKVNALFPIGQDIAYSDSLGAVLNVSNDQPLAGSFRTLSPFVSFGAADHYNFCVANTGTGCYTNGWSAFYYARKPYSWGGFDGSDCLSPTFCYRGGSSGCLSGPLGSSGALPAIGYAEGGVNQSKLNNPMAMISGQEANTIIVADNGNNLVRKINLATNSITNIAGNLQTYDNGDGAQATQASLYHPRGLAYDINGFLYISTENGYIRKVAPDGTISTLAGKPLGQGGELVEVGNMKTFNFKGPSDLTVDNDNGYLYVADTGNHRIVQIDLVDEVARVIAGNGQCTTGTVKEGSSALQTSICSPVHIGLDAQKNLLYLDRTNKRIRKVSLNHSADGIQRFASTVQDNSEIVRDADGVYVRTFRNGSVVAFDANGKHTKTSTLSGLETTFDYNDDGQLLSITDPSGSSTQINYSGEKVSNITDPAGRQTQFHYYGDQLTQVVFPDGTSKSFSYNAKNLLTQEIDQRGFATQYSYNPWNRLSFVRSPDNSIIQLEDFQSKTFIQSYDGSTRKLINYGSGVSDGLTDSIKNARSAETVFVKDTNGFTSTIIDALGNKTTIDRDEDGRPTKITRPDLQFTRMTYDPTSFDLTTRYESSTDTSETFQYDSRGNLIKHVDHAGRTFLKSYDATTGLLVTETDSNNLTTTRAYNSYALLQSVTDPQSLTQSYEYDGEGNVIKTQSHMGEFTTFTRDDAGNIIAKTNAKNQTTHYTFDSFNRLTSVKTPDNSLTTYAYSAVGNLIEILDPNQNKTLFEYNSMGRLTKKVSPLNQVYQMTYDGNGNTTQEIDPKGQVKTYVYDDLDRLTKKILPDNLYTYSYNEAGNLFSVSENDSSFQYSYEQIHGKDVLISQTQDILDIPSHHVEYGRDVLGRKTSFSSNISSLHYTYGSDGQLASIRNHKNEVFSFGRDNSSRLTSVNYNGVLQAQMSYDSNSFLTSMVYKRSNNSVINSFSYQRDSIANRTSMTTPYGVHSYQYDQNNQLLSASHPEGDATHALETFVYDNLSNRTTSNQGFFDYGAKKFRLEQDYKYIYSYDANGNMISRQEKGMNGNIMNLTYSSENQLVKAEIFEGGNLIRTAEYSYDAFGNRTQKKVTKSGSEVVRKYVYEGQEIIAVLDSANNVLVRYTLSGLRTDDMLAMDVSSEGVSAGIASEEGSFFYTKDALGSVIDITSSNGLRMQHYTYSSFGKLLKIEDQNSSDISINPTFEPHFAYTGREYDNESQMYYYRARTYDSHSGRFLQEDKCAGIKTIPSTLPKYSYTLNNPINQVDPSGEIIPFLAYVAVTALIAATATTSINMIDSGKWDWNLFRDSAIIAAVLTTAGIAGFSASSAIIASSGLSGAGAIVVGGVAGATTGALVGGSMMGTTNQIQGKNFQDGFVTGAWLGGIAGGFSGIGISSISALDGSPGGFYTGQVGFGMMSMNAKLLTLQTIPVDSETKSTSRDMLYGSLIMGGAYGGF